MLERSQQSAKHDLRGTRATRFWCHYFRNARKVRWSWEQGRLLKMHAAEQLNISESTLHLFHHICSLSKKLNSLYTIAADIFGGHFLP